MTNLYVEPISGNIHVVNNSPNHRSNIVVHSKDERSTLKLRKDSNKFLDDDLTAYGGIYFERNDREGLTTSSTILGGHNYIMLTTSEDGIVDDPKLSLTWRDGKLGIGKTDPEVQLDVIGNIRSTGYIKGKICLPKYSKEDLKNLQAEDGMIAIIYSVGLAVSIDGKWMNVQIGEEL